MYSDQHSDRSIHLRTQRAFVVHIIRYGVSCTLAVVALLILSRAVLQPGRPLADYFEEVLWQLTPVILTALFVIPLLVYDAMRFSNRVVGPVHRIRAALHDLAEGRTVEPLFFRKSDLWRELGEEFNAALRRIQQQTEVDVTDELADEDLQSPVAQETSA